MSVLDLGNGLFLDLDTGETREEGERSQEEWKTKRTFVRVLPTIEEVLYFVGKDGFYIA